VEYGDRILTAIQEAQAYMQEVVYVEEEYEHVRKLCRNANENCMLWALSGECTANAGYMVINCAPACRTCDKVHVATRCPMDDNATNVFAVKDDLNTFYERIVNDPYYKAEYNVTVISRPTYAEGDGPDSHVSYAVNGLWIVQFDNIVNEAEAKRMIEMGNDEGYERSADVGDAKEDGTFDSSVNDGRTSTNAWCMDACMNDTATRTVHAKIENITTIPRINYENLQILQYHENQYYKEHNDFIEYQVDRPCGSRILTFFIYLTTAPEDGGGGTNFPKLDITVTPKLGRAILWPSIRNDEPFESDLLSNHQALPVLNGFVKYGVNAWIHQRDFQTANSNGCA
jgi:prolyl 4-hydroxylase